MRTSTKYGWIRQRPDFRDYKFVPKLDGPLPDKVDLSESPFMPAVYNQGVIGSCTANAIAAALDFERAKQGSVRINPSRLFIYANERIMEGTDLANDSGAQIRDGIKSVSDIGACPETLWPYHENSFNVKPPQECYDAAALDKAIAYHAVEPQDVMAVLAGGSPVIVGITLYESFEWPSVREHGIVTMPQPSESMLGGHAVLVVGYVSGHFIVRNSWGFGWGQEGHFFLPYDYLLNPNLASDFWVITQVT